MLTATSRAPPGTATGLSRTASTSVKTIVFRPMPRARVATTAAENQRWARIIRRAKRRSCAMTLVTEDDSGVFPEFFENRLSVSGPAPGSVLVDDAAGADGGANLGEGC